MSTQVSKFGRTSLIDPHCDAGSHDRKFPDPPLDERVLTDTAKYYDRAHAEREWDRLWRRCWQIAGRVSDIGKTGEFLTYEIGRESFIVVRSAGGEVRAFYNVCQHRGSRLVHAEFGSASAFICSFHSWAWNIDGSLKRITDRETFADAVVCDNPGLAEVRCAVWGGFVFLCLDEEAPPLADYLGVLPDLLDAYRFEDMVVVKDLTAEWPTNWKTGFDAFLEGYHAHARHPELLRLIDDYHYQFDMFEGGHSRMVIPMGIKSPRIEDRASLTPELRYALADAGLDPEAYEGRQEEVRLAIVEAKRRRGAEQGLDYRPFSDSQVADDANYSIFPNVTLNVHPEGVLVMRFRPHPTDPERCFYDVWVLARPVADPNYQLPFYMGVEPGTDLTGAGKRPQRTHIKHGEAGLGYVLDQDSEFLPLVQAGVRSAGFGGIRLSRQEVRLLHYYTHYDRHLGASA